jgi:spore coat protein U-like protein
LWVDYDFTHCAAASSHFIRLLEQDTRPAALVRSKRDRGRAFANALLPTGSERGKRGAIVLRTVIAASGLSLGMLAAVPAHADINGTINATITLTAGCIINGQNYDDGSANVNFGTLAFGSQNTLFTQVDAQVLSGAAGFTVQCSNGVTPTLSFNAGQNDGSGAGVGVHAMVNQAAPGQFVTYNLYSDAARNAVIPVGGDIVLPSDGSVQTVNVYGRAFGEPGLTPGSYADIVTVVLEL